jgi:hypothetical protein
MSRDGRPPVLFLRSCNVAVKATADQAAGVSGKTLGGARFGFGGFLFAIFARRGGFEGT